MVLYDVNVPEQLGEFYESNNLLTVDEKIDYLKKEMKVRAILYDEAETPEEILAGLEESALLGYWKASL